MQKRLKCSGCGSKKPPEGTKEDDRHVGCPKDDDPARPAAWHPYGDTLPPPAGKELSGYSH